MAKILLAEDHRKVLSDWLANLKERYAVNFGEESMSDLIERIREDIVILNIGPDEIHMMGSEKKTKQAVQEHAYDLGIMDGLLCDGDTYAATAELLIQSPHVLLAFTSSCVDTQKDLVGKYLAMYADEDIDNAGVKIDKLIAAGSIIITGKCFSDHLPLMEKFTSQFKELTEPDRPCKRKWIEVQKPA